MQLPVQVSFQSLENSPALEALIRQKAEDLERFFPRITSLRAVVTRSTSRHRQGNAYHVSLDLKIPGYELAVASPCKQSLALEDPYLAVRNAFHVARRRLQDCVRSHFSKRKSASLS